MLALRIENETTLPDGGPLGITVEGTRGIDIGRDQYLDWTLPDPSRFISGKHCEIRWHDGAYWLHDVSTNGTFLHGADGRLKAPHKLRDGDRFSIGHYIIVANVGGGSETADRSRRQRPPGLRQSVGAGRRSGAPDRGPAIEGPARPAARSSRISSIGRSICRRRVPGRLRRRGHRSNGIPRQIRMMLDGLKARRSRPLPSPCPRRSRTRAGRYG